MWEARGVGGWEAPGWEAWGWEARGVGGAVSGDRSSTFTLILTPILTPTLIFTLSWAGLGGWA